MLFCNFFLLFYPSFFVLFTKLPSFIVNVFKPYGLQIFTILPSFHLIQGVHPLLSPEKVFGYNFFVWKLPINIAFMASCINCFNSSKPSLSDSLRSATLVLSSLNDTRFWGTFFSDSTPATTSSGKGFYYLRI